MSSSVLTAVGLAAGSCRRTSGWNGLLQRDLSIAVCYGSTSLFVLTLKQDLDLSRAFSRYRQQVGHANYY